MLLVRPFLSWNSHSWIWKSCLVWGSWEAPHSPFEVLSGLIPCVDNVKELAKAACFLCDLQLSRLKKSAVKTWSSLSIRQVFIYSNKRQYWILASAGVTVRSKVSICACRASGSTLCTVNFKFPHPSRSVSFAPIRVASHSNREEKNVLKIGKCDCQTPNLDRWNSEGKSNLQDHI